MSGGRLHIFGVRHHGPGSAHALVEALDAADPATVLIEGPPEATPLIAMADAPGMAPPLALLVYAADEPGLASFFPFAEYSPEWQAMLWTRRRGRPARFIDLPASHALALRKAVEPAADGAEPAEESPLAGGPDPAAGEPDADAGDPDDDGDAAAFRQDPLGCLAALAGYDDGESWWNALIEQGACRGAVQADAIFLAVEAAMAALRERAEAAPDRDPEGRRREEQREAAMRLAIADALKETPGAVAVVCGAWHAPALRRTVSRAADKALLKDLPRLKTAATWAPWTSTRLTFALGYGAGIASPGWFAHLWGELQRRTSDDGAQPADGAAAARVFTIRWLARTAGALRQAGRPTPTACVIDAARLAETLAALRGLSLPGLDEMRDATLAALCHGERAPLALIEERLIVGGEVGSVAPGAAQTPLQADLTHWQKRLKLKPEALESEVSLDLRSETGLARSQFLRRLALIGVTWGRPLDPGGSRGAFRERWALCWDPDFSVRLAEAIVYGATIGQAAGACALARARAQAGDLAALSAAVRDCLLAGLDEAAREAIRLLQAAAASTADIGALAEAAPPLAAILRYGTARKMPTEELRLLAVSLVEAACAGLVYGCRNIEEAASRDLRDKLAALDRALPLLDDARLSGDWRGALGRLTRDSAAAALLQGFAARALYDQNTINSGEAGRLLSQALSPSAAPAVAGQWLDGFLADGGQMLLHDDGLLAAIDQWLMSLAEEAFIPLLPMLRRAFGACDPMERRRLLDKIRSGDLRRAPPAPGETAEPAEPDAAPAAGAFAEAFPLLLTILGLERKETAP